MKVLLVNPPRTTKVSGMGEDKLGLLYIASVVRDKGIDVRMYDSQAEHNSFRELKDILKEYKPDIVGITIATPTRFDCFRSARMVKSINRNTLVVAGGPHLSTTSLDTLENIKDIDIAVMGEGEYTFLELCETILRGGSLDKIEGIAFRKGRDVIINPRRSRIDSLDSLPFPARDFMSRYRTKDKSRYYYDIQMPDGEIVKMSNTSIITGRGCPFNCLFCAAPEIWGRKTKLRSLENVISEIKHLKEAYNVTGFRFCDDTFNISKKRVIDICNLILKERLSITWHCHLRADNVDKETVKLMKEAGCYIVSLGVESGSQSILDNVIDKRIKLEKVKEVIKWCDELNIKRSCNFIYSLPGETREDVNKTLAFMEELGGKQPFGPTIILPGSRIESIAKSKGILPKDFSWAKVTKYKYYDPTANSFVPIYVDTLSWDEILGIFYKYIRRQSKERTKNYLFRVIYRLLQIRSLTELTLVLKNYFTFLRIFVKNRTLKPSKRQGASE